jgi:hypothetical protein
MPNNVEILGSYCSSFSSSLSSITFQSNSGLTRIESEAFSPSLFQSILTPSIISFTVSDAIALASPIRLVGWYSYPEFDPGLELKGPGIEIDCPRISRVGLDVRR